MIFIDWLTITQEHVPGSLPVVGSEWKIAMSVKTGELVYQVVSGMAHEGSYETSIRVRCDGSRVEVSGNPSAFGRVDNVFGFSKFSDAVSVFNRALTILGLPIFTPNDYSRPKVRRVDLTENLSSQGVLETLRLMSGFSVRGKPGYLYPNGRTVDWFRGSRRVYVKYYCKAFDLLDKARLFERRLKRAERNIVKGIKPQYDVIQDSLPDVEVSDLTGREIDLSMYKTRDELLAAIQEISGLADYANSVNLVRWEVSLKSKLIDDLDLSDFDSWCNDMNNVIITDKWAFHKRAKFEETGTDDFVSTLQAKGYTPRQSRAYAALAHSWMFGKDVHYRTGYMGRDAYYRARAALLTLGIDIANPPNVAAMPLKTVSIQCESLKPPEWYKLPLSYEIDQAA